VAPTGFEPATHGLGILIYSSAHCCLARSVRLGTGAVLTLPIHSYWFDLVSTANLQQF